MNLRRRKQEALAWHGLSGMAHCLMCTAGYRVTLPREAFIGYTRGLSEGGPDGDASLEELTRALDDLLTRGLMTILSAADIATESLRAQRSTVPELFDTDYVAGHVDFTHEGYRIHRDVVSRIFGMEHVMYGDSGFRFDETSSRFLVLAPTRDLCERRLNEIRETPDAYTGRDDLVLSGIVGPHEIRSWKPNRFIELGDGFQAVVQCSPPNTGLPLTVGVG